MGSKAGGMASGNDEEGGLELGSDEKILTTIGRWLGRSLRGSVG